MWTYLDNVFASWAVQYFRTVTFSSEQNTLVPEKHIFGWEKIELFALVRLFKIRNIFERPIYLTLISRFLYINKITMV